MIKHLLGRFSLYYNLAKPGIIYGNILTTIAAFIFATRWYFIGWPSGILFVATVLGISFVIGSGCVFNNYLDRDIDKKMERTKDRGLVTGEISVRHALMYGTILGIFGFLILYLFVNTTTAWIAFLGFVFYVVLYGLAKRKTHWGAVVGSVAGAVPIVIGYTAVTNNLDITALILFLILVFWQMPHFYAIAMYRLEEYTAAGIPVLPAIKGMRATKVHIVSYILLYIAATIGLWAIGAVVYLYLVSIFGFGLAWLWRGLKGFRIKDEAADARWARSLFLFSLIVILSFSITIAIAPLLP